MALCLCMPRQKSHGYQGHVSHLAAFATSEHAFIRMLWLMVRTCSEEPDTDVCGRADNALDGGHRAHKLGDVIILPMNIVWMQGWMAV